MVVGKELKWVARMVFEMGLRLVGRKDFGTDVM